MKSQKRYQENKSSKEYAVKCNEELVLNLVTATIITGIELPYLKF